MADVVKTPFDVALQHPLRGEAAAEGRENAFTGVLRTASLAEAEGLCVRRRLRYRVKGQSVERLHGPVIHAGDAQRTFCLFALLLDEYPAQRLGLIALVCQGQDTAHLGGRGRPHFAVHARCLFPFIGRHFSDGQRFGIVRMGQKIL